MSQSFDKIAPKQLRRILGMTIVAISRKLNCRRESLYYALGKGRMTSKLRVRINELIQEKENGTRS